PLLRLELALPAPGADAHPGLYLVAVHRGTVLSRLAGAPVRAAAGPTPPPLGAAARRGWRGRGGTAARLPVLPPCAERAGSLPGPDAPLYRPGHPGRRPAGRLLRRSAGRVEPAAALAGLPSPSPGRRRGRGPRHRGLRELWPLQLLAPVQLHRPVPA